MRHESMTGQANEGSARAAYPWRGTRAFASKTRRPETVVRAVAAGALALTLAGCGASAADDSTTGSTQGSAEETPSAGAQATGKPGAGSCEFSGDGPASAQLTELEDGYEVTFTGDFISPDTLLPKTGRTEFRVTLWDPEVEGGSVALVTMYDLGELSVSGAQRTDGTSTPLETDPVLKEGSFTVTYPKPIEALDAAPPTTWAPEMYVDPGDGAPGESFHCGDGQVIPFTPLGG